MSPVNTVLRLHSFLLKNPTGKEIINEALPKSAVSANLYGDSGPVNVTGKDPWSLLWGEVSCRQGFPGGSVVKNLPAKQETQVWTLVWEDTLEEEVATHSSNLAGKIPCTEEPGRLQSMGSQRVSALGITKRRRLKI